MMTDKERDYQKREMHRTAQAVYYGTRTRPDPYGPCPCGSGQKFKFCCPQALKEAQRGK